LPHFIKSSLGLRDDRASTNHTLGATSRIMLRCVQTKRILSVGPKLKYQKSAFESKADLIQLSRIYVVSYLWVTGPNIAVS